MFSDEQERGICMKNWKKLLCAAMASCALTAAATLDVSAADAAPEPHKPVIGITWKSNTQDYTAFKKIIEMAGGIPVELPQVKSKDVAYNADGSVKKDCLYPSGMLKEEYADAIKDNRFDNTNVAEAMKGVDGVFFTGGEDISPSLYRIPQKEENLGAAINAARDISDYTLMSYCIENNIPAFAVCRGQQMLGVVSGATMIQDLPTYYNANSPEKEAAIKGVHRYTPQDPHDYVHHEVAIFNIPSHLHDIVGADHLEKVSSMHHQAVLNIKGTPLVQTAETIRGGVSVLEGIENPYKDFIVGVQFHPENDLKEVLINGKDSAKFCDTDTCLRFFQALVKAASK